VRQYAVSYPSDSLAFCCYRRQGQGLWNACFRCSCAITTLTSSARRFSPQWLWWLRVRRTFAVCSLGVHINVRGRGGCVTRYSSWYSAYRQDSSAFSGHFVMTTRDDRLPRSDTQLSSAVCVISLSTYIHCLILCTWLFCWNYSRLGQDLRGLAAGNLCLNRICCRLRNHRAIHFGLKSSAEIDLIATVFHCFQWCGIGAGAA